MPVTMEIRPDENLIVHEIFGAFSLADFQTTMEAELGHPDFRAGMNALWDFSLGDASGIGQADVMRMARLAEEVGFDSVWLVDHFCYSAAVEMEALGATPPDEIVGKVYGAWECLCTAAALARETTRVEIGTLVVNTGYRNPALLARMAEKAQSEMWLLETITPSTRNRLIPLPC